MAPLGTLGLKYLHRMSGQMDTTTTYIQVTSQQ